MGNDDPVTLWIEQLRKADDTAARKLRNHFVLRLYETAKKRLNPQTRRVYDEEDAALSAFHSACAGISAGRFPDLQDRGSLLQLLLIISSRKVARRNRYDVQQMRDSRKTVTQSIFVLKADESILIGDNLMESREPAPEFAAQFAETCDLLFESLDDAILQQVVVLRMEGCTDNEIAAKLNCSRRTVQRRLEVIRRHWDRLELSDE